MQEAGRITAQAFRKTMAMTRGQVDEALIFAKFDFGESRPWGQLPGVPPCDRWRNRRNTLHYINNNQLIKDGEMVLLDGRL
ncbi:unnamed protein product [Gadus morhua 'NCC']